MSIHNKHDKHVITMLISNPSRSMYGCTININDFVLHLNKANLISPIMRTKELSVKLWDKIVRKTWPRSSHPHGQEGQLSEKCPKGQLQHWRDYRAHWLKQENLHWHQNLYRSGLSGRLPRRKTLLRKANILYRHAWSLLEGM